MARMEVWTYRRVPTGIDIKEFDVEAADGSIGTIDEVTARSGDNYIVVDTGPWILGKKVLLPAGVVDRIDTREEKVFVNRSREEIRNAPEFDEQTGATDTYRQQVGSYYTARAVGETRPRRRSSSSRRTGTRRRTSDEPTRDELYEQAKRLDIEGRSKMNKTQLKRAVSRKRSSSTGRSRQSGRRTTASRGRGKTNPVEVQAFLKGVSYPTRKGDLLREAQRKGASRAVRSTLDRLPEERFKDATEVSKAVGKLSR